MKRICILLGVLLLVSCNYFNVKKTSSETILNEELKTFNWNEVDTYPSFASCDSSQSKAAIKQCFQNTLTTAITNRLQTENIIVSQNINDTIMLKFQISETGLLSLLKVQVDSITEHEIPNIQALLSKSVDSLPKIYPALKRGQQVTTEFSLPIIIHMN